MERSRWADGFWQYQQCKIQFGYNRFKSRFLYGIFHCSFSRWQQCHGKYHTTSVSGFSHFRLVTSGKLCFYPFSNFFQSPFHDALATNPIDVSEFQPLNVIESLETSSRKSSSGYSSRSSSGKFKKKKKFAFTKKIIFFFK